MPTSDRFGFEREHYARGLTRLAGVDEAGRGPLAGPVVAAAVVLPYNWYSSGVPECLANLDDSKRLTEKVREELYKIICSSADIDKGIAVIDNGVIDEVNILQATYRAMNEALGKLAEPAAYALVDGRPVPSLNLPHSAIIKGDSKSYSIGAASILAKVTRDRLMVGYDQKYPEYGFATHKGYGTQAHLTAIKKEGACPIHRMSFAPLSNMQGELFT